MNRPLKSSACAALCFLLSLPLPRAAYSQGFSSINNDLLQLENLIGDTLRNAETQETLLQNLKQNLDESGQLLGSYESTIAAQENLLRDLQNHLDELSAIYNKQSSLSARYAKSSRFWRAFTLAGIPAAALLSGILVFITLR